MLRAECGNCVHASPPFCRQIMAMLGIARFLDSQSKSLRDPLIGLMFHHTRRKKSQRIPNDWSDQMSGQKQ